MDTLQKKLDRANQYLTVLSEALCDKPDASFDEMLIAITNSTPHDQIKALIKRVDQKANEKWREDKKYYAMFSVALTKLLTPLKL